MPRRPRVDRPGRLHHVMNRGVARRTVFETRLDRRVFLALLARAARAGRIEIHAFVILTTHFHLLVRSLDGCLSETMRRVLNLYVRWFNRKRRRDGPLFRGRFRSIPVDGPRYFQALVRYIDDNPVEARMTADAFQWEFSSARHHVADGPRPRWLCREIVSNWLSSLLAQGQSRAAAYRRVFPSRLPAAERTLLERRLLHADRCAGAVDMLRTATSPRVLDWMSRKASLADGTRPGLPLVLAGAVSRLVDKHRSRTPPTRLDVGGRDPVCMWDVVRVALLRDLAGETLASIERALAMARDRVRSMYAAHREALARDVGYRGIIVELARRLLAAEDETFEAPWRLAGDEQESARELAKD